MSDSAGTEDEHEAVRQAAAAKFLDDVEAGIIRRWLDARTGADLPDDTVQLRIDPLLFPFMGELAPNVLGYTIDGDDDSLWIPVIQAADEGAGDVGRYLDTLPHDRRVVVPTVLSSRLAGMLHRRGFVETYEVIDGEAVQGWFRDADPGRAAAPDAFEV